MRRDESGHPATRARRTRRSAADGAVLWAAVSVATLAGCDFIADLGQFDGAQAVARDASSEAAGQVVPPPDTDGAAADDDGAVASPDTDVGAAADAGYQPAVRYDFEQGTDNFDRNTFNNTQNWGIVSVTQTVAPVGESGENPAGPTPNHCLAITYDSSLKPDAGVSNNLEVVNPAFGPPNLGTVPGLTLSVDLYVYPDSEIGMPVEFGVQDESFANCFFVHYDNFDVHPGTWVTLSSSQTGICGIYSGQVDPLQLSFQFVPQGKGTICIDNITW